MGRGRGDREQDGGRRTSRASSSIPCATRPVMAGNGTIGLELVEQLDDIDAVLIPWGGGGLTTGVASALRAVSPGRSVYVCEPETGAPVTAALANGGVPRRRCRSRRRSSTARARDRCSPDMWEHARPLVSDAFAVSLEATAATVKLLLERGRIVAEGAAALPVAAALAGAAGDGPGRLHRLRREHRPAPAVRDPGRPGPGAGAASGDRLARGGAADRRPRAAPRRLGDEPARHGSPLGFLQIDPISTVAPPQYLVPWSRLGAVRPGRARPPALGREEALRVERVHLADRGPPARAARMRRRARSTQYKHEQWGHEFLKENAGFKRFLLRELERNGPMLSRELEHDAAPRSLASHRWWGSRQVALMLDDPPRARRRRGRGRRGGQRLWDLAERWYPDDGDGARCARRTGCSRRSASARSASG